MTDRTEEIAKLIKTTREQNPDMTPLAVSVTVDRRLLAKGEDTASTLEYRDALRKADEK